MLTTLLPLVFSGIMLFAATASGQAPAASDRRAQVDAVFKDYTKPGSPGCTVAVYEGDRVVESRAFGMANLDTTCR